MLYIFPQKLDRFGEHQLEGPIFPLFSPFWHSKKCDDSVLLIYNNTLLSHFSFFCYTDCSNTLRYTIFTCRQCFKPTVMGDLPHIPSLFFFYHIHRVSVIPIKLFFLPNETGAFDLQKKHETESIIYM